MWILGDGRGVRRCQKGTQLRVSPRSLVGAGSPRPLAQYFYYTSERKKKNLPQGKKQTPEAWRHQGYLVSALISGLSTVLGVPKSR